MYLLRGSGSLSIDALMLARLRAAHLRHLAEALSPAAEPPQIAQVLLDCLTALFPTAHGTLSLLNWDRREVEQVWPFGGAAPALAVIPGDALNLEHPWGSAAESGQALFIPHGETLPLLSPAGRGGCACGPFAVALVPLPSHAHAHGMLTLELPGAHALDPDDQAFLVSMAALGGQAIDRAVLTARQHELQEALHERNLELRGYSHALSHNLGEPVQRIWNFLRLVEGQLGTQMDVRTRRLFTLAQLETGRIAERLEELRSLTVIERQALRLMPLDLNVLLVQVRHDLEPLTRKRGVRWEVRPLPKVQGDTLLMWQVLMELLAFAVEDAWDAGPPVIRIEAQSVDDQVVLCLQSNGQGFAEGLEERIFEVLDRSVPRTTAFGRLGLSNVRRALGRQGGWVRAEGRPGQGVRFLVSLPQAVEVFVGERVEEPAVHSSP